MFIFVAGKEKVVEYLCKNVRKLKFSEFEHLAPELFDLTLSHLVTALKSQKLSSTTNNLALLLQSSIEESGWDIRQIIFVATSLELEWMKTRHTQWQWQTFQLRSIECDEPSSLFSDILKRTIRSRKEDAEVLLRRSNGLYWLAVIYKRLDILGLYTSPIFFALSTDLVYLFARKKLPAYLLEAILEGTHSHKIQSVKLSGRDVPSLLGLLRSRENADMLLRPEFNGGAAVATEEGIDYTMREDYKKYVEQCFESDLSLNVYEVQTADKNWVGDDSPELKLMEIHSKVIFSGNVNRLLSQLPSVGVCRPPFSTYIRDFTVFGRSAITIASKRLEK